MDKPKQTHGLPRGIRLVNFPARPDRPHGVQWRVSGQRKTKTFDTKERQLDFAKSLAGDFRRNGLSAFRLDENEARQWRAFRAQIGPETDLDAVAACWARNKASLTQVLTIEEAVKEYTAAKKSEGVDPSSISHYGPIFDRFKESAGAKAVGAVTRDDINDFLARMGEVSADTRRTRFARVRALFNWLVETGKLDRSPFTGIKPPRVVAKQVEILTLKQTQLLFSKNASNEDGTAISQERRETLGRLALEAFAGLRNDSAGQVVAAEIQADGLRLPAAKLKTRQNKFLDGLPANLHAWLVWSNPGQWTLTQRQYLDSKTAAFTRANIPHPRNCLRKGFGTYHLAAHKNPAATSVIMCHTSPKLLHDTYGGMASQADGLKYFEILPPVGALPTADAEK